MKDYEMYWGLDSKHEAVMPRSEHSVLGESLSRLRVQKCNCDDWLQQLAQNYDSQQLSKHEYQQKEKTQSMIAFWVRALFDAVRKYADEFNLRLNSDALLVNYVEPEFHRVGCSEKDHCMAAEMLFYEGHFVTQRCALLLRGIDGEIEAFIVPSEVWLGLAINTIDESQYPPLLRITIDADNKLHAWLSQSKAVVTDAQLNSGSIIVLAKILFRGLIEESLERGELECARY